MPGHLSRRDALKALAGGVVDVSAYMLLAPKALAGSCTYTSGVCKQDQYNHPGIDQYPYVCTRCGLTMMQLYSDPVYSKDLERRRWLIANSQWVWYE